MEIKSKMPDRLARLTGAVFKNKKNPCKPGNLGVIKHKSARRKQS
jgi:hypothetical protein